MKTLFHQGIPPSPFIAVVYRYADTMLAHGRDTHGPQKTGLFLSALDRETLAPLGTRPPAPAGLRPENRPGSPGDALVGANPQLDENLLRLLYFLKGLSGEDRYPQAADAALGWFFKNTQSPATGLLPWGEHLCWNVTTDDVASGLPEPVHEFSRPWLLWDRCFELAPEASRRFAVALWKRHVNSESGVVSSRAHFSGSSPRGGSASPRHAGFYVRAWAEAYARTTDGFFLNAIRSVLDHCQALRSGQAGTRESSLRAAALLSFAIDCDGAARKVPEPLRTRLGRCAAKVDETFCSLRHDLEKRKGFAVRIDPGGDAYTTLWEIREGGDTTAKIGMMCASRYENTGKTGYRDLVVAAADAYRDSLPGDTADAWPMTFGHAISLELAAFRVTAGEEYHRQAFRLGEVAVEKFFGGRPLPRASLRTDHYESTTGADTLALALAELHLLTLHITAVRAPVNTIDR